MRYSAIKPRIVQSREASIGSERPPSRLQEFGDKVCCAGVIVAGLVGYVFAWLMISGMR